MVISEYNSRKIKILNLLLIIMVVYIHNYYQEANDGYVIASILQNIIGKGICRLANPLFFFMSGMLFFNNITSIKNCFPKIKKRIKSLLIPYIIWNCIYVCWFIILSSNNFTNKFISNDVLNNIFGGTFLNSLYELFWKPAAMQLWFLRDLIISVLFSPLLYILINKIHWLAFILIFIIIQYIPLHISAFFVLGGTISLLHDLNWLDRKLNSKTILLITTIIFIGNIILQINNNDLNQFYTCFINLNGIIFIWKLYDYIYYRLRVNYDKINNFLGYSFFIYLFHEPTLNILKKGLLAILGTNELTIILLYIINPILMCLISIYIATILKKIIPKTYSILTGGR